MNEISTLAHHDLATTNLSELVMKPFNSLSNFTTAKHNNLVNSFTLLNLYHLPQLNDALCLVKDLSTGAIRQTVASKLLPISYGKDAYLLELTSAMENDNNV